MAKPDNNIVPYAISAVAGLVICLAITLITGRSEAWDSGAYFIFGIPLMCTIIFLISYRIPQRAWRWTFAMAAGQSVAMVIGGGSLSLWPLAIIAMTVVSIPQFVTGLVASRLALKGASRNDPQ